MYIHVYIRFNSIVLCCVSQASIEEKAYRLLRKRKQGTVYALRTILTQAGISLDTSTPQKAAHPPSVPSSQPPSMSIISHMHVYVQHVHVVLVHVQMYMYILCTCVHENITSDMHAQPCLPQMYVV